MCALGRVGKARRIEWSDDEVPPPQSPSGSFVTRQAVCLSGGPRAHFLFVFFEYIALFRDLLTVVATIDNISELFRPAVTALGLELWGVEHLVRGRESLLRIYIDGPAGISIEDCEKVSRQVSAILDVEDPIPGEYTLEVSSPGFDRPLFDFEQFGRFLGEIVSLRLRTPLDGRRKFKGKLEKAENGVLSVTVDGNVYDIPYQQVDKANIAA